MKGSIYFVESNRNASLDVPRFSGMHVVVRHKGNSAEVTGKKRTACMHAIKIFILFSLVWWLWISNSLLSSISFPIPPFSLAQLTHTYILIMYVRIDRRLTTDDRARWLSASLKAHTKLKTH